MSFGDGHTCQIEGIGTIRIKLSNWIVRKLKDVRYVPQLKKNFILVRTLEAKDLKETLGECVFKMSSS